MNEENKPQEEKREPPSEHQKALMSKISRVCGVAVPVGMSMEEARHWIGAYIRQLTEAEKGKK